MFNVDIQHSSSRPKRRDLSLVSREHEISPFRGYATPVEMTEGVVATPLQSK